MLFNNHEDSDWLRQSFLLPVGAIDARDQVRRTYTEASRKFTDTTLGGNYAINCPPQFTRFADRKRHRKGPSRGMGRYYSEAIDDNSQLVNLRFGVPEYNSMFSFFTSFYNADMALMARQGRTNGFFYGVGRLIGFVVGIPLQLPILTSRVLNFMMGTPRTKYYYLKPAMPLYWNAVSSIVNELAVNLALIPAVVQSKYDQSKHGVFSNTHLTPEQVYEYNKLLPDIMRTDGGIDIYAVATRAHRLQRLWNEEVARIMSEEGTSLEDKNRKIQELDDMPLVLKPTRDLNTYVNDYLSTAPGKVDVLPSEAKTQSQGAATDASYLSSPDAIAQLSSTISASSGGSEAFGQDGDGAPQKAGSFYPEDQGLLKKTWSYLLAEEQDGAQFVTFRTDYTGTSSESFSSSTKESDIASTFNSASGTARDARFSLADGNLTGVIGSFMKAAGDVVSGIAQSVGLSGLLALNGSGFVDIPKHWESSTAQLPRAEFTLKLRSPYGNDQSRLQCLLIPLAMCLAGTLPLSTGQNSYTSPFLCECYCRGRCQIRLGMIESLSISRGEGNLGWNRDGKPLGIDVTFSVVDLSSIMHMPLAQSVGWQSIGDITAELFGEDSTYRDYMSVLSSMTLSSQIYQFPKLFRNITRITANTHAFFTASHLASAFGGSTVGRWWSAAWLGADRL